MSFTASVTGGEYRHTLTIDEMPSHGGHLKQNQWNGVGSYYFDTSKALKLFTRGAYGWQVEASNEIRPYREYAGGNSSHNIMQPYIVTYMWRRVS